MQPEGPPLVSCPHANIYRLAPAIISLQAVWALIGSAVVVKGSYMYGLIEVLRDRLFPYNECSSLYSSMALY